LSPAGISKLSYTFFWELCTFYYCCAIQHDELIAMIPTYLVTLRNHMHSRQTEILLYVLALFFYVFADTYMYQSTQVYSSSKLNAGITRG
jgi:hypothetical protein